VFGFKVRVGKKLHTTVMLYYLKNNSHTRNGQMFCRGQKFDLIWYFSPSKAWTTYSHLHCYH